MNVFSVFCVNFGQRHVQETNVLATCGVYFCTCELNVCLRLLVCLRARYISFVFYLLVCLFLFLFDYFFICLHVCFFVNTRRSHPATAPHMLVHAYRRW